MTRRFDVKHLASIALLFLPAFAMAEDWDMGTVQQKIQSLEQRVAALEAKWDMGTAKSCPCPTGGKCICPADNCPCELCLEHLTAAKAAQIYAKHEKEISKIWEALGDREDATMKAAVEVWIKQQIARNQGVESAAPEATYGVKLLGFFSDTCIHCPGAKTDCAGLDIEWIDADSDPRAKEYHVTALPALVRLINGHKQGHFEGRTGMANQAKTWLRNVPATTGDASPKVSEAPRKVIITKPAPVKVYSAPVVRTPSRPSISLSRMPGPSWSNPGDLRSHLIHQHGWNPSQINSMSQSQLNILKDNCHNSWGHGGHPYAGSRRSLSYSAPRPAVQYAQRSYQPRVYYSSGYSYGGCPNGMCPR